VIKRALVAILLGLTPAVAIGTPDPPASSSALFSYQDYPRDALAKHEQGIVRVKLSISAEVIVTNCAILQSATPSLDQATCRILTERARFIPAKDRDGNPMHDEFVAPPIRWQIASDPPAPPARKHDERGIR
jgi:TonB family protein